MSPRLDSPANPRIKAVARLEESRERRRRGRMRIEGRRELARALAAGYPLDEAFYQPEALAAEAGGPALLAALEAAGVPRTACGPRAFAKLAYRRRPEVSLVAVAPTPGVPLAEFSPRGRGPLLVIEGVEKPGNLGAILRSADGAGAAGVLLADALADRGNPNACRASLGTIFHVPLGFGDAAAVAAWLRGPGGYRVLVATPEAADSFHGADLTGRVALVLGAEATGVTPGLKAAADGAFRVPMRGVADSLNLAQTATLLAYEALRQAGEAGGAGG